MDDKWKQYKNIVGYGIGQYYETVKEELFHCVKLTYLCDKKWMISVLKSMTD